MAHFWRQPKASSADLFLKVCGWFVVDSAKAADLHDRSALRCSSFGKSEDSFHESAQLTIVDNHFLECGIGLMMENVGEFHQVLEFLGISGI